MNKQPASQHVITLTPAAPDGVVRIVQFSDLHLYEQPEDTLLGVDTEITFSAVMQLAKRHHWPPDLVLVTGDMVHSGSVAGYKKLRHHLNTLKLPVFCLPGNHDNPANMHHVLNSDNVSTARHIAAGAWNIIMLDSTIAGEEGGRLEQTELEALERCLSARPEAFHLIALHHPPNKVGSAWLDVMDLANPGDLFAVLDQFPNTRCVINGHVHQEHESRRDGIQLISSPSTCVQFKPNSDEFAVDTRTPGYRWMELYPDGEIVTATTRLDKLPADIDFAASGY